MTRRRQPRRGVLLLIVLSLLVLFVLIGVTFIVVAGQYTKAARAFSRHELKGDPPAKELDGALMQLLRGTTDSYALMYRHNLLRDLYGVDGFEGTVLSSSYGGPSGHQFLVLQYADVFGHARLSNDYYSGSVLTLLDGQGIGRSARIVRYRAPEVINGVRAGALVIEAFEDLPPAFEPAISTRFVVNGKPFNGSGDGYDPRTGMLGDTSVFPYNQAPTPFPSALMPFAQLTSHYGDSDETWDAADYQNLFLARIPSQIPLSGVPNVRTDPLIPSFHRPFLINYWMHRITEMGMNWGEPTFDDLRRYTVARPMPDTHPFFTGGNSAFLPADRNGDGISDLNIAIDVDNDGVVDHPLVQGPWDVDNDNDGVPDSIWVDLGAPVTTTADGRLYKPLYAILCVDLDGRLNVNAHGAREVLAMNGTSLENLTGVAAEVAAGPTNLVTIGQGYGPAEIRLDQYFRSEYVHGPIAGLDRYMILLSERYRPRYGLPENPPAPGLPDFGALFPPLASLHSALQLWGLPSDYRSPVPGEGNLYLTPADLSGVGGVFLDAIGQPQFVLNQNEPSAQNPDSFPLMGTSYTVEFPPTWGRRLINARLDHPYKLDLVTLRGEDSAFGEENLEELLRFNDLDSQMMRDVNPNLPVPVERSTLARILGPLPQERMSVVSRQLTTRSFDIPALNATIPNADERAELAHMTDLAYKASGVMPNSSSLSAYSLVDLLTNRLRKADPNRTDIEQQLRLMLPPEVRAGGRMDVNRLFGNGVDDSTDPNMPSYGTVDEPNEWAPGQKVWGGTPMAASSQFGAGDPHYDPTSKYFSRQQFARHLYCLALLAMDEGFVLPDLPTGVSSDSVAARNMTARRIAQWAVNVVDFRDSDTVMTPFEYDADPFDDDGWNVDDNYLTVDGTPGRQIVWGCESPELLITETLAFHDRRVRDTDLETWDPDEDDDESTGPQFRFPLENRNEVPQDDIPEVDATLDQFRIPQGSLFVELYATGNGLRSPVNFRNPGQPPELYRDGYLELHRLANDGQGDSPVWRIAIAVPNAQYLEATQPDEGALFVPALLDMPDLDLDLFRERINDYGMLANANTSGIPQPPLATDRFILFTDRARNTLNLPPGGEYFYNVSNHAGPLYGHNNEPLLRPGEYAVIGPRPVTAIGSLDRRLASIGDTQPSQPSYQRIVLRNEGVYFYDFTAAPPLPRGLSHGNAKPALTILAAAAPPASWSNAAITSLQGMGIGVNVSEPMPNSSGYYRAPITNWPATRPALDPGISAAQGGSVEPPSYYADLSSALKTLPDVPFDGPDAPAHYPLSQPTPMTGVPSTMTGTHLKFRVVLLQRLADPTRSWHLTENPYLTVDSQTVDLTVFNGEDDSSSDPPQGWDDEEVNPLAAADEPFDAYDPLELPDPNLIPEIRFRSRERGHLAQTLAGGADGPNVWNPISQVLNVPNELDPNASRAYWEYLLSQSLGALNTTYGARRPNPPDLLGAPTQPIPWLTWNNRPFVSQLELMLVPSSAPWRLPYEMRRVGASVEDVSGRQADFLVPWAHLLNFFYEEASPPNPNFTTLLDWLEVPSRFVGTQKWLSPELSYGQQLPDLQSYGPPFNKLSRFRDPGKVNVNTIPDSLVWQAIDPPLDPEATTATPWLKVQASLVGVEDISKRPAFYANPLRAAASARLMPPTVPSAEATLQVPGAEATLFRSDPGDPARLLFDFPPTSEATNPNLHPYFQYHKLQRLGNLLTSHSNVYAVWITVGYFEVYPWNATDPSNLMLSRTNPTMVTPVPDKSHPDGYQLGAELGSDTGETKRHRAFYIIDRSIPAGFKPGQDLNVDRTIVLRRYIE